MSSALTDAQPARPIPADEPGHHRPDRFAAILAVLALVGFAGAAALVLALDATVGGSSETVSAYVFTHPVEFTSAVVLLVAGSVALGAALARRGHLGVGGGVLLGLWAVGLIAVAIFPKTDWSVGPSLSGQIHRVGSLIAFFALPLAVAVVTARSWRRGGALSARLGSIFGLAAAVVLGYLVWAVVQSQFSGIPWYHAIDLGLVERILIGFEVAALAALAVWVARRPALP
ncbi:DUF998 domain-containing protein [Epidermidibacterium keratini]|uniref:DUF998 domain-containing protein n=1 Tax=Epidermidibacterium keratini TaxID=1891644 RepID=A0A7L4YNA2_9ACTN|nr:DUF998 domain-containing protein [Epidermidibacterium keratini]QHC00373.1 DUF998 domain-containing protein [Epidermidibacterium keratini]